MTIELFNARGSSAKVIGNFLLFAGLFLLLIGGTQYYSGSTTRAMSPDSVLEDGGVVKVAFGIVALLVGAGIAATSSRKAVAA